MTSAPSGSGRVTAFLKTLPTLLPSLPQGQAEICGEAIGHVEPEELVATDEPHDAGAGNSGFPLQGAERNAALPDRLPERFRDRRFRRLTLVHCVNYHRER